MRLSKSRYTLLLFLPLFVALTIFLGISLGKTPLLHFYLYRLGLLPSFSAPLHIPMPEVIPHSGPTEKLLGRFLLLFSWDLEGTLEHPTLGTLPFHLFLDRDKGDLTISTKTGGIKASWRGKKRWVKFDHTPLSLLSSLPAGQIQGEWADERGHRGSVLVTLKTGETISFRGEGEKVLIHSSGLKLEGDLNLHLPIGKPPTLLLTNGVGKWGQQWGLKNISFDSSQGKIEGQLQQEASLVPLTGLTINEGFGHFTFDIEEKKLFGNDFEATLTFLNEEKKALFPYWEADKEGGAFEVWIENEGLIKGIYRSDQIHLFEGSFFGGVEMGPLKLTKEKIEGAIRSDLAPLIEKWSRWSLFPLPSLPILEGTFEGEILLTAGHGVCHLVGENLNFGGWPLSQAAFNVEVEPDALHIREGSFEDCLFSFDLIHQEGRWVMPSLAVIWRDFLRGTAEGEQTEEGAHIVFNHLSADLTVLEAIPPFQEILHRFDLKGRLLGSGELFYSTGDWSGSFKVRGQEWMSGEKAFPFLDEMSIEIGDHIRFSGGSFQLEKQFLTLQEGVVDEHGVRCYGTGVYSIPSIINNTLSGPWKYQEGIFSGVLDLPLHGLVEWEKGFYTPLFLSTPLHGISCQIEDNGSLKGRWGETVTFEMVLQGGGRGEGKAKFLGLPLPNIPIESPLPLEIGWIYPSVGTLPFKLTEEGLQILPGGELFSEGKGIRYEKVEGMIGWDGALHIRLLPKASRLPLYWLERGEIDILGTVDEPKVEVKWR